jgi:hypothetical protein
VSFAYFTIFRQGRHARAARFVIPAGKEWPAAFRYEGRTYLPSPVNLCNGDHLLNAERELMGFTFLLGGETEVGHGRLARECVNAENRSGFWLKFFVAGERSCQNDGCQLLYPFVYTDGHSDHIILVQECPGCWTALGFRLASPPLPEAVFETAPPH